MSVREFFLKRRFVRIDPARDAFLPAREAVCGRGCMPFVSREGGRLLLRIAGEEAYFAMPVFRDAEDTRLLLGMAERAALARGAGALTGPVSAGADGFGLGVPLDERTGAMPWHPDFPAEYAVWLEQAGYARVRTMLELRRSVSGVRDPFAGAAERAEKAGYTLRHVRAGSRDACEAMYRVAADGAPAGFDACAKVLRRVARLAKDAYMLVISRGGEPMGILLTAEEERGTRVLNIEVTEKARRSICAAALLDRAWSLARGTVCVSTVDAENPASLRIAQNAGFSVSGRWGIYRKILK